MVGFFVPFRGRLALAQLAPPAAIPLSPNAFLRIGADDSVTVLLAHSEMGQGVWTTLPMLVAEELDCDWTKIRVEHAPAARRLRAPVFGMQMTGGSTSTWAEFDRYRQVGAMARMLLVQAAAARWGARPRTAAPRTASSIAGGQRATLRRSSRRPRGEAASPGEGDAQGAADWRIIGKPTRRLDTPEKIDGRRSSASTCACRAC